MHSPSSNAGRMNNNHNGKISSIPYSSTTSSLSSHSSSSSSSSSPLPNNNTHTISSSVMMADTMSVTSNESSGTSASTYATASASGAASSAAGLYSSGLRSIANSNRHLPPISDSSMQRHHSTNALVRAASSLNGQSFVLPPPPLSRTMSVQNEIRLIAKDSKLSPEQKTKLIQDVYTRNTSQAIKEKVYSSLENVVCTHYERNCDLRAFCCGIFFPCRLCHDNIVTDHKIDRHATREMRCRLCKLVQPVGPGCANPQCSWKSTRYYCAICKLWVDNKDKEIFHCDKCKICRVGKKEDYFHCDICHLCLSNSMKNNHTCRANTADALCPVCNEHMFSSTSNVDILPCGHSIHVSCMKQNVGRGSLLCPVCKKTAFRSPERDALLAHAVEMTKMPEEYAKWQVRILCNDCELKGYCPYHFYGHQCQSCKSFNTSILTMIKDPKSIPAATTEGTQQAESNGDDDDDVDEDDENATLLSGSDVE